MTETADTFSTTAIATGQLKAIVERIERLELEKADVAREIGEVYAEAKGAGFDTATIRKVVSLRKKNPEERSEQEAMLDLYLGALGMVPSCDGEGEP